MAIDDHAYWGRSLIATRMVKFDIHALPWLNDQSLIELRGIAFIW
ncbi:MAG: hypothetical protein ACXWPS_12975 [Ktedonobacteraceae bacterium]